MTANEHPNRKRCCRLVTSLSLDSGARTLQFSLEVTVTLDDTKPGVHTSFPHLGCSEYIDDLIFQYGCNGVHSALAMSDSPLPASGIQVDLGLQALTEVSRLAEVPETELHTFLRIVRAAVAGLVVAAFDATWESYLPPSQDEMEHYESRKRITRRTFG